MREYIINNQYKQCCIACILDYKNISYVNLLQFISHCIYSIRDTNEFISGTIASYPGNLCI